MNDSSLPRFTEDRTRSKSERDKLSNAVVPRLSLIKYWNIARRYKWSIFGIALLGALIGFHKATSEIPEFQASLSMLIEPRRAKSGSVEEIVSRYASSYRFYQTQAQIVKSRAIAERIAEKLDAGGYVLGQPESTLPSLDYFIKLVGVSYKRLVGQISEQSGSEESAAGLPVDNKAFLANSIHGRIQVEGGSKSQIVVIRFESYDPEFAAAVVNTAADAYIELNLDTRLSAIKVASSWLTDQVENLRQKVTESEARLQSFQTQESLVDTGKLHELTSSRLTALNAEFTVAQSKVSALEKRYGNKHPSMIAAKAELREIAERLQGEKGSVVQTQSKSFELAKLERDVDTYRQLYDQFLTRFKETDLAMRYNVNDVRVIDRSEVPSEPIRPNKQQIISRWLMFGLFAGVLLAWLRDFLDNAFNSPQDVEQHLAMPVIGAVPFLDAGTRKKSKDGKQAKPERFYIGNNRSGFAESINHVRTSILYTNVDDPPKVIMLTSATQAEGKTTLCTNLALAFSQLGKTLLLDADLRKPRVAEITGLGGPGVADVVAGHAEVADSVVQDPAAQNLYVMESGTQPPNPLELLSSKKFAKLITGLKPRFDHILLDGPPILPVSDAVVLGRIADAAVIVVRAGKTQRSATIGAVNTLQNAGVNVIGAVLSQVTHENMSYYYPENYYGYYGEYYGRGST